MTYFKWGRSSDVPVLHSHVSDISTRSGLYIYVPTPSTTLELKRFVKVLGIIIFFSTGQEKSVKSTAVDDGRGVKVTSLLTLLMASYFISHRAHPSLTNVTSVLVRGRRMDWVFRRAWSLTSWVVVVCLERETTPLKD